MTRDRLLENLRWLEESSLKYASASKESQQDTTVVVHPMDDHFLLSYIDAQQAPTSVTRYSS